MCGLSEGVTRFLKSMENTVTGLDRGGERVMCQAEHVCGDDRVSNAMHATVRGRVRRGDPYQVSRRL